MIPNRRQKDDACKMTKQQNVFFLVYQYYNNYFEVTMSSNSNQTMINKFLHFMTKIKMQCPSLIKCLWLPEHPNKAKREQSIRHCILVIKLVTDKNKYICFNILRKPYSILNVIDVNAKISK